MGRARTELAGSRRETGDTLVSTAGRRPPVAVALFAAVVSVGLGGCSWFSSSKKADDKEAAAAKRPELQCPRQGVERLETGSWRGDGKTDVVRVFVKSPEGGAKLALGCKEVDLNGDGRKDVLVHYDPQGRKQREEFDHDFDGVADLLAFYQEGQLARQELDVNYDGTFDVIEHYEGGRRVRVEKKPLPTPPAAPVPVPTPSTAPPASPPAPAASADGKPAPAAGEPKAERAPTSPVPTSPAPTSPAPGAPISP